ncbi:DUF4238 domain-containing protein [Haliea sp. E1-2-M8]|uniref:DUF4238 domain-containing protein n=1 Tax=Haliea sp. E1-2-M8 TaxID=3064706 RepID=UPI0027189420|nr:DUF4238 domain-containing protein [Haliea sp. E1-2-M8]MDO8864127.1 DUF4238 domain-containing protein [Haliea sp. E1-2-M8]
MSKHKKQHVIPRCYLKAWCDSRTPKGQTPYVWIFPKDQRNGKKKAPDNIFHQTEMYTINSDSGERDLTVEKSLSGIEDAFTIIRNSKLNFRRNLTAEEHFVLCIFVSSMHARTIQQLEHMSSQWRRPLEMMEKMDEQIKAASPEKLKKMSSIPKLQPSDSGPGLTMDEVRKIVQHPVETMLFPMISTEAPILFRLDFSVLCTNSARGFITSDAPCVWRDPEAYKRPPLYRSPALGYKSIEILLPVSPSQCIFLNRSGIRGYLDIEDRAVSHVNRTIRFSADAHFISNQDGVEDHWFDPGVEPEDSWENRHRNASKENQTDA